ncbi:hypothetical protein K493DRAFT_377494 [Basidiobolus meristosporus CBS 931.73]|uniref:Uncharacterized protein n=1 Tax=Basidiobolus meristosporus CBS 931.73 TaxID=1314790 RepID=A0A1Y1Y264_9FUNG|nr:hypothetical protein K493DRAFT_377494 [Basidiobolus meristosporus CBS 931.73]|eukprot:ORX92068.1 hypothetical protein K493DRAFT_377494 [Basidiobolus meristosporus CBS 931.73]
MKEDIPSKEDLYNLVIVHHGIQTTSKLDDFDPYVMITSHFVSTKFLIVFRLCCLALFSGLLILNAIFQGEPFGHFLLLFTNIANIGLILYFGAASYFTFRHLNSCDAFILHSTLVKNPMWRTAYWQLYHTIVVFQVAASIVFWSAVMRSGFEYPYRSQQLLNYCTYVVNLVLVSVEICLSKWTMSWSHLPFMLFVVVLYMVVTWIYFVATGQALYTIMNLHTTPGVIAVRYLCVFLMLILVFVMMLFVHRLRENLASSFDKTLRGKRRLSDIEEIEEQLTNPRANTTPTVPNFAATQFPVGCQQLMSILIAFDGIMHSAKHGPPSPSHLRSDKSLTITSPFNRNI